MPYLPSDARKKSELYDNVLSGDVLEYQNEIEDLKKSLNISGSVVDAKQPLRDSTEEQISTEQVEFQATVRDYLIQFVNEHFKEENTPDISTDRLHEKLTEFFKTEYDRYIGKAYGGTLMGLVTAKLNKGKNADGWEDFRLNKKREVRGISGKRFKEVKKDLRNFRYDEIVEDHLYRTLIGQEIWLKLGFPYIVDKKLD